MVSLAFATDAMHKHVLVPMMATLLRLAAEEPWLPPSVPPQGITQASLGDATLFGEAGLTHGFGGFQGRPAWGGYAALDGLASHSLSEAVGLRVNARLEGADQQDTGLGASGAALILREAFLSWRAGAAWTMAVGRMHIRDGVALGFNPTDPFRLDARTEPGILDPKRFKATRLGVLGLSAQYLEEGRGVMLALTPAWTPKAGDPPWYDPQLGLTNRVARGYLKIMPGPFRQVSGNVILSAGDQGERLAGLNLSRSLGQAAVLYAEGARLKRSEQEGGDGRWFGQATLGATYTTPWRQTLALEYRYNGSPALDLWPSGSLDALRWEEPASKSSLMAHFSWDAFLRPSLALTLLWLKNAHREGDSAWMELTWRKGNTQWSTGVSSSCGLDSGRNLAFTTSLRVYLR